MRNLLCVLLILSFSLSLAQIGGFEKPDYKQIEKNIQEKNSNLNYEKLMQRFQKGDSTMTLEEGRHLYYGYIFHENYSPYTRSDYEDSLYIILDKTELDTFDFQKIIRYTDEILEDYPFDMNAIDYQLFALDQTGQKDKFGKRLAQIDGLVQALLSSGNGISKSEAIYVINTSDEYYVLNLFDLQFNNQQLIEHYDYLALEDNEMDIEGLYFDVSPCLNTLTDMYKD